MFRSVLPLIILTVSSSFVFAQVPDTSALNDLRLPPRRVSLPVRRPVLAPVPVDLPPSELLMDINPWRNWASFGLNLNQAAFSNNWSNGGVNSLALGTLITYKTDYTRDDKNFVSEILLQYGKLKNKDQLARKTNDRIFWDNKMSFKLSKNWSFFGSINFESQFDNGYTYSKNAQGNEIRTLISRFMSPGYVTESVGFEYKPVKHFFVRIGTGTARQTFVLDDNLYLTNPKNFGVKQGRNFRNELAFQVVGDIDRNIAENLNLKSRYAMFANYERLANIDHRLDVTLSARINRFINVSLAGIAIYDDDTDNRIQSSQALSLGLVLKVPRL